MKRYPQFHDGELEGLIIDQTTAYIYVNTLEKEHFVFICYDVDSLKAEEIREGNIILDVAVLSCSEIAPEDIQIFYEFREGPEREKQRNHQLEILQQEKYVLFELSPSYGGRVFVVARSIELQKRTSWNANVPGTCQN